MRVGIIERQYLGTTMVMRFALKIFTKPQQDLDAVAEALRTE